MLKMVGDEDSEFLQEVVESMVRIGASLETSGIPNIFDEKDEVDGAGEDQKERQL